MWSDMRTFYPCLKFQGVPERNAWADVSFFACKNPIDALLLLIEQIYTEKFVSDTNFFKASLKEGKKDEATGQRAPFPHFVCEFLKNRIKSPKQLIQAAIDLVASIEHHRKQCLEADIFCKFMEETFDQKDLIFFLYIRSLVEKELDLRFNDLKEQNLKSTSFFPAFS